MDLTRFDIREYLEDRGIEYEQEGKHVTAEDIEICCPFCGDDPSFHLGIHLDRKIFNCWRCRASGTVIKLIMKLEKVSFPQAAAIINKFSHRSALIEQGTSTVDAISALKREILLPSESQDKLLPNHKRYLESRGFNAEAIFKEYDLKCADRVGRWKFRLIIPVYHNRKLVTWTARDTTNLARVPYLNASNEESLVPIKNCLYNIDKAEDTVIVVEGPIDVWKIGRGSVATFGTQFTSAQLLLLTRFKRVFILYDADAKDVAHKLGKSISVFVPDVYVYDLDIGDPADLNPQEIEELRRDVFGKFF